MGETGGLRVEGISKPVGSQVAVDDLSFPVALATSVLFAVPAALYFRKRDIVE